MSVEILAPAGNMDALEAAIAAGADAVYFGLPEFGARAYAGNFTLEQAGQAIERLHLAGMKAYIAMNTILYESEIQKAFEMACRMYELNADAIIAQDLGLIELLHQRLPKLEVHASTQLSVNRPEQIEQLKKLGVKRVVLARECTLEQIKACAATGMELEAFVHGALCISYSGQCQFSAVKMNRSGNRGQCAQPCRMKYRLLEDGRVIAQEQYLISPKDLSLVEDARQLEQAGVFSLKIEGRMKSPVYVYESVAKIRKVLNGQKLSMQDHQDLASAFSRGFTKGHIFKKTGNQLMNPAANNHQGVEIGRVVQISGRRVLVRLSQDLHQNDAIRYGSRDAGGYVNFLYDEKGRLCSSVSAGHLAGLELQPGIKVNDIVRRTVDARLNKEVEQQIHQAKAQIEITGRASCTGAGEPLVLELFYKKWHVKAQSSQAAQPAVKKATDSQMVYRQLNKTGSSFARFKKLEVEAGPGLFWPLPVLNALRKDALDMLKEQITACRPLELRPWKVDLKPCSFAGILAEIQTEQQHTHEKQVEYISEFDLPDVKFKASLNMPEGFVVSHLGRGEIIQNMNVTNSYAAAALLALGYQAIVLSDELDLEQTRQLTEAFFSRQGFHAPLIVTIYQKRRLMIMRHCPVNTALKDGKRKNCRLCHEHTYTLESMNKEQLPMMGDRLCNMRIFSDETENKIDFIPDYLKMGIQGFLVQFVSETAEQAAEILKKVKNVLEPHY